MNLLLCIEQHFCITFELRATTNKTTNKKHAFIYKMVVLIVLKSMLRKIISAYLKSLSKYRGSEWRVLLKISFSVLEILAFFYFAN